MAEQEFWRGKFVDRDWLKSLLRDGFARCAKQDLEAVLGSLVNDIEEYVAGEVILNSGDAVKAIIAELQKSMETWDEMAAGISEHQIKRRAAQLGRKGAPPS